MEDTFHPFRTLEQMGDNQNLKEVGAFYKNNKLLESSLKYDEGIPENGVIDAPGTNELEKNY